MQTYYKSLLSTKFNGIWVSHLNFCSPWYKKYYRFSDWSEYFVKIWTCRKFTAHLNLLEWNFSAVKPITYLACRVTKKRKEKSAESWVHLQFCKLVCKKKIINKTNRQAPKWIGEEGMATDLKLLVVSRNEDRKLENCKALVIDGCRD